MYGKGIVSSDKRWNFVFWKEKKIRKKSKKVSDIFSGWYHDCLYEMNGWSREGERRRMETMVLTLSVGAVLPLHEQLINVPEPAVLMYTPPLPDCL